MLTQLREQPEARAFLQSLLTEPNPTPLLLVGDNGVGRRFAVKCYTRAIFCKGSKDPNCACSHCTQIVADAHPDVVYISASKAIGVDLVRDAITVASECPSIARWKFITIEGVDNMTVEASNALLKILEEPPRTVRFFLLANSAFRVLPTIASRCWHISFRRLPISFIKERLSVLESDAEKVEIYARLSDGSLGRAIDLWGARGLKLRDKVLGYFLECASGDVPRIFSAVDSLTLEANSLGFFETLLYDTLLCSLGVSNIANKDISSKLQKLSEVVGYSRLVTLWSSLEKLLHEDRSIDLNFHLKSAFVRIFV